MTDWKAKGNGHFSSGQFKEAADCYAKAIAADPNVPALYSNRSAAFGKLAKWKEALADAEKCVALDPSWYKAHFRKAEALLGLKRFEEALEAFNTVLQKDPSQESSISSHIDECRLHLEEANTGLFFKQLECGKDIATRSLNPISSKIYEFARTFINLIYIIGDVQTKQALVVDPCWDVDGIQSAAKAAGYEIVGAIITHRHFDHRGGLPPEPFDKLGIRVSGLKEVLKKPAMKAYVGEDDVHLVVEGTGVSAAQVVPTKDGTKITLGAAVQIEFIHTPGHSPGSQCVLVNGTRLLSGDTLFVNSCGRHDLPGGDGETLWKSLQRLSQLPESIVVFPAHNYGGTRTTIAKEKRSGYLRPLTRSQWLSRF